ncbi:fructose-specific PTS transporter subunit EIIC [Streptomyces sp. XD-27]|uniref:fructose-specific PTS transporter subunit EIIC n=1 Tax=Streptomyces sp. XD-27 TaxID=3062779 RepID=UPI0026F4184E|nr:fructose-specific PTS transporter subunit EIIC [Streptomyces sp. XD-27]WKX70684.1 fructose-specific PTS transporter subunit EIIC [Streptomyces sp. XD-27]
MTSPADPPASAGTSRSGLKLVAVTACPTGIAHTYMAAEKLAQAAESLGHSIKVETQGSIGAENVLSDNDVRCADAVIVAADKDVDRSRFVGKRVLVVGVAEGVHHPDRLIERARSAPVYEGEDAGPSGGGAERGGRARIGGLGGRAGDGGGGQRGATYKALMNGVSYMIPFVVVGGLLIAVSLALGGHTTSEGIVIPEDSVWKSVNDIGAVGFALMIPILSGYIAYAIADRPALVPGMVGGWIAAHGELYDSEAGAGFIGAIVTGFLAGYLVLWIKKARVPRFVQPIMPIIVIPIVATTALGLFFVYVIGEPISWLFEHLTDWLGGLTGTSAALLGIVLGLMIAFDMGGPVNKTAFLFGAGLVSKNPEVMGMCAAAIPVPPLGQGLATLIRRRFFDEQERETGLAALFMGFFGITEGAIPFAAARPARVIPANMLGGAAAGAVAGIAAVEDSVPHGGPIVALLGAVGGVPMFFVAVAAGTGVTAVTTVALMSWGRRDAVGAETPVQGDTLVQGDTPVRADTPVQADTHVHADAPAARRAESAVGESAGEVLCGHLSARTVKEELAAEDKDSAIREMAELLAADGKVADVEELVRVAFAREEQGSTGLGEEIAIPHAKTDAVTAPVVGFARSAEGIEWGSLDGTKARLIFMIAVPEAAAGDEHLRILALLSRKLMDDGFRERLRGAAGVPEILGVLGEIR